LCIASVVLARTWREMLGSFTVTLAALRRVCFGAGA
jgi:hypothetical protein